jgi:hypothetical protein
MRPVVVSVGALGSSTVVPLDHYKQPFNVGVGVVLSAGATMTYTVEHTFSDPFDPAFVASSVTWFPNTGLSAKIASSDGNYAYPVRAVRLTITSYTSGTATMTLIQAGMPGR